MEHSSRPHAVTVYRSGATVERRVQVPARTGAIVLPGLPLSLVDGSISVQADEGVRVASARVRLHARPREDAPEAPDHTALRSAREELTRARRQQQQLQAEVELLTQIPMPERPSPVEGQAPPPSPLQARLAFDAFVDGETRERHGGLAELELRIVDLERQVADLEDRIRRHQGAKAARPEELTKSVHVELHAESSTEGTVELRLRYHVPGCRWVPRYALRLEGEQAQLELRAAVAQGSGEDWEGVELTLSTAMPQAYSALPSLPAARIGKAQPPPPHRPQRPPPRGAEALFADVDRAVAALPAPRAPSIRTVEALVMPSIDEVFEDEGGFDTFGAAAVSGAMPGGAADMMVEELSMDDEMPAAEPAPAMTAPPPPAPKAALRSRAAKGKKMKAPRPRRQAVAEAEAPMESPADTGGWPDYGALQLPGPYGAGRGRLQPRSAQDQLVGAIHEAGIHLPFDVGSLLSARTRQAVQVRKLQLPDGARAVRPSHFDHAVRADRPVDVPSLGTWHTVALAHVEGQCRLRYVGVPREEAAIYRIATLPNPCSHPLLAGPVEVYVDGAYVLTASLPTTGSGADVELGVGVEPALHVARNTRFEERRSDERVVAMRELHHHIAVELRNDLGHAAQVEIRERVPVPDGDAEVAIDVVTAEPPWEPYDQEERGRVVEGGHRWTVEMAPRSQLQLDAHYVVRLYANHEVVGGDRREA